MTGVKLLLLFLSVTAGTMTGFYFYKREYCRRQYFEKLIDFCNALVSDMRFSQRTISALTEDYMAGNSSCLDHNLKEYLNYVGGKSGQLDISKGNLKVAEFTSVRLFFKSLGMSDSQTQIFEIENYKSKFCAYKEDQIKRIDRYAKNFVKLGFLLGLAIGILIL